MSRPTIRRPWIRAIAVALAIPLPTLAFGQEKTLEKIGRANRNFGMADAAFRRFVAEVERSRRRTDVPASTVEALATHVSELRLMLAPNQKSVVGEVTALAETRLESITLQMEEGPVSFADNGRPPDRQKSDRVFTALMRSSPESLWPAMRQALAAVARLGQTSNDPQFVRRGPRDLVPVQRFVENLKREAPASAEALQNGAKRAGRVAEARTLAEAVHLARIDPSKTPLMTIPVPGGRIDRAERFRLRHIFDIPVVDIFPSSTPIPIDEERSLMVVHPSVVDDTTRTFDACSGAGTEGGAWSFGHLIREMAQGTGLTPEDFTLHWLSNWMLTQEANGFVVNEPARAAEMQTRVIDSWQRLSGPNLNVDKFPARLLAIINRPDLADKIGYGVAGSAGEGRFVFGLLEKPDSEPCNSLPFTVIFEYGIKAGTCTAVKAWHQRWKALDAHALDSPGYRAALELITRDFTDHGTNPAQVPNQSSLNQLRTNENALDPTWQLREFRLQSSGAVPPGVLDLVTVKQTPDDSLRNGVNGTAVVAAYIIADEVDIVANRHKVPERFPGIFDPFMGAKSDVPFPPSNVFWNAPGLATPPMIDALEARRKFSLSTCNACHGGETNTFFTHIGNLGTRNPGSPAALSGFLTGIDVTLPVPGMWPRHYHDLAEREAAMSNILTSPCFALLGERRLSFVH